MMKYFRLLNPSSKKNSNQIALYFEQPELGLKIIRILQNNIPHHYKFVISKILVEDVADEQEQQRKIRYTHEAKNSHRSIKSTYMAMVKKYYWPNMSQYIENYISKCQICLTMKTERHPQHVEFKRTETPSKPFELINIDTGH